MKAINIEIKARCKDHDVIRAILEAKNAESRGTDHQLDTYFNTPNGRLKLREGNIENNLIFYHRSNTAGPKKSDCLLFKTLPGDGLKDILLASMGELVRVDKQREIFFIGNIKVHLDEVTGLGSFVEIEAQDKLGTYSEDTLHNQCEKLMAEFDISEEDLVEVSYSDLLLEKEDSR